MEKTHAKVIFTNQGTLRESWKARASTFVLGMAFVGIGRVIGSSALEWMGALVWFLVVLSAARAKNTHLTIS